MIRNDTQNIVLAKKARMVRGLFSQAFGLMFRSQLVDEGWVFLLPRKSKWHVTNVFVFQSITVLWLDENKTVLKVSALKPFTPHAGGISNTSFLIELPSSAAQNVAVGDRISWKESKRI